MDFEKYYRIMQDGTYSIHFANKKGFSKEQINDTFSPFGKVLSTSSTGDFTSGLIFIRYKTLKETLYCLKSLQKNNDIHILPQKDKIGKQKIQQSSKEYQKGTEMDSFQETFVNDKQYHSNTIYSNKVLAYEEKPTYRRNSDCVDNVSDFSSSKPKHAYKSYVNAIKSNISDSLSVDEKNLQYPRQQNYDNKISSCNQVTKQQENKFNGLLKSKRKPYSTWAKNTFDDSKIPSLISDPEKESDIKIDHSLSTYTKNTSYESIVTMQEVIVANIHADYGVHYILHLFEKCNPVSATLVKTIFQTDIRYCFVYFINIDDALVIEKEFDNFALSGKNLIVLRKSQLNKAIYK